MAVAVGSKLGPYEVLSFVGAGGMGEVYRARDTRLRREVAIKVLRAARQADESHRRRFEEEARTASALNHPNIATIYDIASAEGTDFIVMEYVDGKPLSALVRDGMSVDETIRVAIRIADALTRAHGAGIIHRDLKPANVVIASEGTVKVLDFGMAKLVGPGDSTHHGRRTAYVDGGDATASSETVSETGSQTASQAVSETMSETVPISPVPFVDSTPDRFPDRFLDRLTSIGGGTPGYMSPEQATGGYVDPRSDIFSFGAMLYEMVTGRRAFHGASIAETLKKVVWEEPAPIAELTSQTPPALERLIVRCLRKAPDRRFQTMAEVKTELTVIQDERTASSSSSASSSAAASAVASPSSAAPSASAAAQSAARTISESLSYAGLIVGAMLVITVVIAAAVLFVRRRDESALTPPRLVTLTTLRGTEATPAFSPDGNQIAFSWDGERRADGRPRNFDIWVRPTGASDARRLTSDPADDLGPSWSPDGRHIAFHRGSLGGPGTIHLMPASGGAERKLTDLPAAGSEVTWFRGASVPQLSWSPDSRWLAAARARAAHETHAEAGGIHLIPIDGGASLPITAPKPPAVDRDPAFSPDGRRLAYAACSGVSFAPCDIHIVDLDASFRPRSAPVTLMTQGRSIVGLAWTSDGRSIVYGAARFNWAHLWRVDVDGARPPERIEVAPQGLSPAAAIGRQRLAFAQSLSDTDIHAWDAGRGDGGDGASAGTGGSGGTGAVPGAGTVARGADVAVVSSSLTDHGPAFSPDGRKIAFESGRSGEVEEIWIADADGSNPVQVTRGPGIWQGSPQWSPDGTRIVFDSRSERGVSDVYTIEVNGGGLRRITSGALNEVMPAWSRDGRSIYYQQERADGGRDIWRVAVTAAGPDGQPERVTTGGGVRGFETIDGKAFVFARFDDESPLFVQPLSTRPSSARPSSARPLSGRPLFAQPPASSGEVRAVADCIISRSLTSGPDGMYYIGCPADVPEGPLFRLDPASGVSRRLGVVKYGGGFVPGMTVSPDGKRVLFSAVVNDGGDLMMIEHFRE